MGQCSGASLLITLKEGALTLHALVDETLYATTQWGIYAINAQNGQIRWLYQSDTLSIVSGPPLVADRLLYAGTSAGFDRPQRSHVHAPRTSAGLPRPPAPTGNSGKAYFCALDVATGAEVWRYPMGHYIGAVVHDETIYVNSGDCSLSAREKQSGRLRWHHQFGASASYPATIANDVLYININSNGAYALRSEDGAVLWHQPLGNSPGTPGDSFTFDAPVVLDGAVYLVCFNRRARGVLYALDARTGAECWHTPYPPSGALLAVAQ